MTALQWGKQSNDGTSQHSSSGVAGTTLQCEHKPLVNHTSRVLSVFCKFWLCKDIAPGLHCYRMDFKSAFFFFFFNPWDSFASSC